MAQPFSPSTAANSQCSRLMEDLASMFPKMHFIRDLHWCMVSDELHAWNHAGQVPPRVCNTVSLQLLIVTKLYMCLRPVSRIIAASFFCIVLLTAQCRPRYYIGCEHNFVDAVQLVMLSSSQLFKQPLRSARMSWYLTDNPGR